MHNGGVGSCSAGASECCDVFGWSLENSVMRSWVLDEGFHRPSRSSPVRLPPPGRMLLHVAVSLQDWVLKTLELHVPCPMSHAPCPMSHVPYLMPHISCPISHVSCLMSHVSCPVSPFPCPMSHVPCPLSHVPCPTFHVPMSQAHIPCNTSPLPPLISLHVRCSPPFCRFPSCFRFSSPSFRATAWFFCFAGVRLRPS